VSSVAPTFDAVGHTDRVRRATRWLALLCVLLVTHGSLYPWRFRAPASFDAAWTRMMVQTSWWTGFGDVVGNVVLFVPVGVLGWALARGWRTPPWLNAFGVVCAGAAFAFALQVAQIYVPARDAAWSDVVWNTLGLLLGLWIAAPVLRMPLHGLHAAHWRVPIAFALLWLLLQWWPMVPRLDWQHVKDALKPLLLYPSWRTLSALDALLSLVVLGALLRPLRRRALLLLALPPLAAFGTLLIDHQVLSVSRLTGWVLGTIAAVAMGRLPLRTHAWLGAASALAWFTVDELKPFTLANSLGTFHWMPFEAALQGSLTANTLALAWQLFWLGAVMVLVDRCGVRPAAAAVALGACALLLEALQMLLPGRVADITPALLPWFWALALPLLRPAPTLLLQRGE
jgi:VanZ family protein